MTHDLSSEAMPHSAGFLWLREAQSSTRVKGRMCATPGEAECCRSVQALLGKHNLSHILTLGSLTDLQRQADY